MIDDYVIVLQILEYVPNMKYVRLYLFNMQIFSDKIIQ